MASSRWSPSVKKLYGAVNVLAAVWLLPGALAAFAHQPWAGNVSFIATSLGLLIAVIWVVGVNVALTIGVMVVGLLASN